MTTKLTTTYFQRPDRLQPSPDQQARLAARQRFNQRYVYFPLGFTTILWLGLIVGLLWLTIVGDWFAMDTNQEYYRALASGVADALIILMVAPLLLFCALPIAAFAAFTIYRWSRRRERVSQGATPYVSLPLPWRIENIVVGIQQNAIHLTSKMARPIMNAHAAAAFIRTFLLELREIISLENDRHVND